MTNLDSILKSRDITLPIHDFAGGSDSKESACSVVDLGLILGLGRSPGRGNGNTLQYSCLENPMQRGAWWTIVHEVTKESDMTQHTDQSYSRLRTPLEPAGPSLPSTPTYSLDSPALSHCPPLALLGSFLCTACGLSTLQSQGQVLFPFSH